MRNLVLLLVFLMSSSLVFANSENPFNRKKVVYETGKKTEKVYSKKVKYKQKNIVLYLGIDKYKKVSEVSVSGNLTKTELSEIEDLVTNGTCVTDCSRENHCSDKPTMAGVGGCYAECAVDCIAALF